MSFYRTIVILISFIVFLLFSACTKLQPVAWDPRLDSDAHSQDEDLGNTVDSADDGDSSDTADSVEDIDADTVVDEEIDENIDVDSNPIIDEDNVILDQDIETQDFAADEDTETPDSDSVIPVGSMVSIPSNSFWQGCRTTVNGSTADIKCYAQESPYHQVLVPSFQMDVYEVTTAQYVQFLNANGNDCFANKCVDSGVGDLKLSETGGVWSVDSGLENFPIVAVTWYGAKAYCEWVGKRLPSESEWELAARGTDERLYPWGDETATCEYAVMNDGGSGCGTASPYYWAVGSKSNGINPYGLFDMAGNVWEWVEDDWHRTYTDAQTDGSAWIDSPTRKGSRVLRGGSWYSYDRHLRVSYRSSSIPGSSSDYSGFRCAK